jgi:hypothetical protein
MGIAITLESRRTPALLEAPARLGGSESSPGERRTVELVSQTE